MEFNKNEVGPGLINKIIHGKLRITADTALRLARYFGMSPRLWLGLQIDYDLDIAEDEMGDRLREIVFQKLPKIQKLQPVDQPH